MAGERDVYGRLKDPGEAYQEFMLGLYDIEEQAREIGYSKDAVPWKRPGNLGVARG